ncbi:tetratricopeptide repeat protein [Flavobacterium sp.]|uniref:tetratricopeptide repeat protein n=1 Tax=Flavobacterium sp. TaxID=239 RepID=UPI0039E5CA8D
MKSKYVILASALLISVSGFAQKDQIKAAEKALKGGNPAEAINQLKQAEATIGAASESEKAQYNFVKGNAAKELADKKIEPGKNISVAAKAYQDVISIEKAAGKSKYSEDATAALKKLKTDIVTLAQTKIDAKDDKGAADLLYQSYEMDKSEPENLYFAAIYYMRGEDYGKALANFQELKKINYSGEKMNYYAKNEVSGQEEFYGSGDEAKKNRDSQVRLKLASAPRDEKVPSKKGEIARYVALIYMQQKKFDEAKAAIAEAKAANPNDTDLLVAESEIYLQQGDMDNYKKVTTQLVEKNPNDASLFFNLGVASAKADPKAAEDYYKRAIAIAPDDYGANLNLALLYLRDEQKLVDEMNKLGNSEKDNKKYEALKKQRDDMFRSSIPYFEKAYDLKKDPDVGDNLLNIYGALEMTDKRKALKAKLGK